MFRGTFRVATVVGLLVCLLWLDACLYLHIQSTSEWELKTSGGANSDSKLRQSHVGESHNSSDGPVLTPVNATIQESIATSGHRHDLPLLVEKFSFAFKGMSIKLMMTDPVDNYLMGPLAESFAKLCNFRNNFHFVTPNGVSYAGVVSALIGAKLVSRQDSPTSHKLAFVFFQLRTWLDDLDGIVARVRLGITKHVSLKATSGYVVDGVCDAIGFVAFVIGCYVYLKNSHLITYRYLKDKVETCLSQKRLLFLVACFLLQLALCAAFWNRYILLYHDLLESPTPPNARPDVAMTKQKIIKSNLMFIIIWFWRLTNGHMFMQMLAVSVLLGKIWQFLEAIKFIGFIEILTLAAITELHVTDMRNFLS